MMMPFAFLLRLKVSGANGCSIPSTTYEFARDGDKNNYKRIAFVVNQKHMAMDQRPSPTHNANQIHRCGDQPVDSGAVDEGPRFKRHGSKQQPGNDGTYHLRERL